MLKAPVKIRARGFKADIRYDRVLGISVNIPAKAFCPAMYFLSVCNKGWFYTFGRIDWVGLTTARGAGLQECQREFPISRAKWVGYSSPFDHH